MICTKTTGNIAALTLRSNIIEGKYIGGCMYNKTIVPIDMVKKSISLKNIGINELAWYGKDTIDAIEYLSNNGTLILGGDVYIISEQKIKLTYDNWYYIPVESRPHQKNIDAAKEKAVSYIQHFMRKNGNDYLYSIVY